MSEDYLRLRNPNQCPNCGYRGQHPRNGSCGSCGTRLFPTLIYDFERFSQECFCNFWAFDRGGGRGWINRDHLLVKGAKPQTRELNLPKLPKNYGQHTTPNEVVKRGGKLKKKDREKLVA